MRNEEDDTGSAITNTVNATVIEAGEAPAAEMSAYERRVLRDIARHRVEPGPVRRVLEVMGKPVDKLVKWAGSSDSAMVPPASNTPPTVHSLRPQRRTFPT